MDAIRARRRQHRWSLLAVLCVGTLLGPVWGKAAAASEIVDVRVGSHPGFTRIVFELDEQVGYRIEHETPEPGQSQLVVSIGASSSPRQVQPSERHSLIGAVRVSPQGESSIARIELLRTGMRMKEMILASPARIVVDILDPATAARPDARARRPRAPATKAGAGACPINCTGACSDCS